jgi:hypothetical protein
MALTKDISKIGKTRQKQKDILRKMIAKNSDIQYLIDAFSLELSNINLKLEK